MKIVEKIFDNIGIKFVDLTDKKKIFNLRDLTKEEFKKKYSDDLDDID